MLRWLKNLFSPTPAADEPKVFVFLTPLVMLLAGRERQKGSPLTVQEVLEVRDNAQCTTMSVSQAKRFYASLDAQVSVPRIDPENIWAEWQVTREQLQ